MNKYIIIIAGVIVLAITVTVVVMRHQASPNGASDPDQQVNEVTRNLHPTKLNP
jgi:hypothetical protein